jgi:hypothetical protein
MIKVAQCWDDGVLNDLKLTELLRKYNAKATFNLNPALHRYSERGRLRTAPFHGKGRAFQKRAVFRGSQEELHRPDQPAYRRS